MFSDLRHENENSNVTKGQHFWFAFRKAFYFALHLPDILFYLCDYLLVKMSFYNLIYFVFFWLINIIIVDYLIITTMKTNKNI